MKRNQMNHIKPFVRFRSNKSITSDYTTRLYTISHSHMFPFVVIMCQFSIIHVYTITFLLITIGGVSAIAWWFIDYYMYGAIVLAVVSLYVAYQEWSAPRPLPFTVIVWLDENRCKWSHTDRHGFLRPDSLQQFIERVCEYHSIDQTLVGTVEAVGSESGRCCYNDSCLYEIENDTDYQRCTHVTVNFKPVSYVT